MIISALGIFLSGGQAKALLRSGEVLINEIMWMGVATSSDDEWIELRNASTSAIDLNGLILDNVNKGADPGLAASLTIDSVLCPSTTTIAGSGYLLIGNATSGFSYINNTVSVLCATTSLNLFDNYKLNGALVLREGVITIDSTPASSTTAWTAGATGAATTSMSRDYTPGDGTETANWHSALIATNWDTGTNTYGTPGSYNGYSVAGSVTQLNGYASSSIYIIPRNHTTSATVTTYTQNATGTYQVHLFSSADTGYNYDFLAFRDTNDSNSAAFDSGTEQVRNLTNSGSGYSLTSTGLSSVDLAMSLLPVITTLSTTSASVGDTITITGKYFGDSTTTAQAKLYIPQGVDGETSITSWSPTSIAFTIPTAVTPPGPQTGNLTLQIGPYGDATTTALTIKPKITSAMATPQTVIVNFDIYMDGSNAMAPGNYSLQSPIGTGVSLSSVWTEFRGNKIFIKGLGLTAGDTFSISANSSVRSVANTSLYTASSSYSGTVAAGPVITSVSPNTGAVGTTITITGTGFGTATGTIYFSPGMPTGSTMPERVAATLTNWSNTAATTTVPSGAKSGPITLITSTGVESEMGQSAFFDASGNASFKIYRTGTTIEISSSTTRIVIGKMGGPTIYYMGDSASTTYANGTTTLYGVSSSGMVWAFDTSGTYMSSSPRNIDPSTTTILYLDTAVTKISGTLSGAAANRTLVIFSAPAQSSGDVEFRAPNFIQANANGTTSFSISLNATGTFIVGIEDPGFGGNSASSVRLSPANQTVNASSTTAVAGLEFTFQEATARIHGKIAKAGGTGFDTGPGISDFHVMAYQPIADGIHASAMPDSNGEFDLYVIPGIFKVMLEGPNLPSRIEESLEIKSGNTNFATTNAATDITLTIKAPTEYISGQVTDSNGNAVSGASIFAWQQNNPGGGQAITNSSGYYKLYVSAGTYTVEGFTPQYGKLTSRSGVTVVTNSSTTVDFAVSSELATISGWINKNSATSTDIDVWVTNGQTGPSINRTRVGTDGSYSIQVPYGSGYYLHMAQPGRGEIYQKSLSTFNSSNSTSSVVVSINTATLNVKISPKSVFTNAFVEAIINGTGTNERGLTNNDTSLSSDTFRQYSVDVPKPSNSETWTYKIQGGIPGYGPMVSTTTSVTSGTVSTNITISLENIYTVSGTVADPDASTAENESESAFVWASSASGNGGGLVSSSGTFSFPLKAGTYDFGIDKKNYAGNMLTAQSINADASITTLTLSSAGLTIAGTVSVSGNGESDAWVWATNGAGGWAGDMTDGSGNYSLKVTSGTWRVQAVSEGYNSTAQSATVSSGTTTMNISLATISGYSNATPTSESIVPTTGGIIKGDSTTVQVPAGALSSQDTSTGRVSVEKTTSIPQTNGVKPLGSAAYDITACNASGTAFTTLNSSITITLAYSSADLTTAGLTQAQAALLSLGYWDSTNNNWVSITTNAATSTDGSVTYTGTTDHLSAYAPLVSSGANPPDTPTGLAATAGDTLIDLAWTASSGATKYYIYRKDGELYPYLTQTTGVNYRNTGLSNGTIYYYKVSALNSDGDESVSTDAVSATPYQVGGGAGSSYTYAPIIADTEAPTISDITVAASSTEATIAWKTNESSISWITYGTSTSYGLEVKTTSYSANHSQTITGLTPSTTYHYKVKSKDSSGNIGSYLDKTFTALALGETALVTPTPVTEETTEPAPATKPVSQMNATELQAEIVRITALIVQLQAELVKLFAGVPVFEGIPTDFKFKVTLKSGMISDDVKYLQIILNSDADTRVAETAEGSPGKETRKFGYLTKGAVVRFQEKYRAEILTPLSLINGTGIVGSATIGKLNQLLGK